MLCHFNSSISKKKPTWLHAAPEMPDTWLISLDFFNYSRSTEEREYSLRNCWFFLIWFSGKLGENRPNFNLKSGKVWKKSEKPEGNIPDLSKFHEQVRRKKERTKLYCPAVLSVLGFFLGQRTYLKAFVEGTPVNVCYSYTVSALWTFRPIANNNGHFAGFEVVCRIYFVAT